MASLSSNVLSTSTRKTVEWGSVIRDFRLGSPDAVASAGAGRADVEFALSARPTTSHTGLEVSCVRAETLYLYCSKFRDLAANALSAPSLHFAQDWMRSQT